MKQFDIKDPSEKVVLTFDFSADLASGETLAGSLTTTIACSRGADPTPGSVLNGVSARDATSTQVLVPVQAGLAGCDYTVKVVSATSNVFKVLALAAALPVRD